MSDRRGKDLDKELREVNDRLSSTRAFRNRVFRDEPIVRRGMRHSSAREQGAQKKLPAVGPSTPLYSWIQTDGLGDSVVQERLPLVRPMAPELGEMPAKYREMRALGRSSSRFGNYVTGARLFYDQARLMEDFEDDFQGKSRFSSYYPTYDAMSDRDLRCYFSWRTRLRKATDTEDAPPAPLSFLFVHAYELLCGVGVEPGVRGYEELERFAARYASVDPAFDRHMARWMHDYVVFHGLDASLLKPVNGSFSIDAVTTLRKAEKALLGMGRNVPWPERPVEGLPEPQELLDALCALSRYRADKSRFVRDHREDVAHVASRVFARMVGHCAKRRKTGLVDGLFGMPAKTSYAMFKSAIVWFPQAHPDVTYVASPSEAYRCVQGFWRRLLPCRRLDKSKELGALMHAIDCRMRERMGDAHPLKARSLPKYQAKFVDEEIEALCELREAEEAARVVIDRTALRGIRTAAVRTREALLTDEERGEDVSSSATSAIPMERADSTSSERDEAIPRGAPGPDATQRADGQTVSGMAQRAYGNDGPGSAQLPGGRAEPDDALGLSPDQVAFLQSLLDGDAEVAGGAFASLTVDAINDAFLDVVGDTVIEFDGDVPVLVEDYVDDVREALS